MSTPFTEGTTDRKELTVSDGESGRLDAWLTAQLDGALSRNRVKDLINGGAVTLNGQTIKEPKRKVSAQDHIILVMPEPEDPAPKAENLPLDILYEDMDLVVLNKAAGMVVHPGAGNATGTLVNALLFHCGDTLSGIGGVKRPGIVHRLDKNTSGVMIIAKNDLAHRHLAEQFADHGRTGPLERAYLALVWGEPAPATGTINAPLGRANADRTKRAVKSLDASDTREAITHYRVRDRFDQAGESIASLIECRLETGRTHQIRVHLSHIGHPLIGDREYGAGFRTKANRLPDTIGAMVNQFPRQALHAYLLQFEHPKTRETMRFEAPLPDDMSTLVSAMNQISTKS